MDKTICTICKKPFYPRGAGQTAHATCRDSQASVKIIVIPDTQVKPGVDLKHLTHIGAYIADKRPDVIVHVGDHWDMPSLSSYDVGKRQAEGRRVRADFDAGERGMNLLMNPIAAASGYNPRKVFLMGNHEYRVQRAVDSDAKFEGIISTADFKLDQWGWESHEFLEVVNINGVDFSHYFVSGPMGRPVSSPAVLLRERQKSAVQGHVQRFDMAVHQKTGQIAMFVGIAYTHYEEYLTPQGNGARQQVVMLHDVNHGIFDPMFVSLKFLRDRYHGKKPRSVVNG